MNAHPSWLASVSAGNSARIESTGEVVPLAMRRRVVPGVRAPPRPAWTNRAGSCPWRTAKSISRSWWRPPRSSFRTWRRRLGAHRDGLPVAGTWRRWVTRECGRRGRTRVYVDGRRAVRPGSVGANADLARLNAARGQSRSEPTTEDVFPRDLGHGGLTPKMQVWRAAARELVEDNVAIVRSDDGQAGDLPRTEGSSRRLRGRLGRSFWLRCGGKPPRREAEERPSV